MRVRTVRPVKMQRVAIFLPHPFLRRLRIHGIPHSDHRHLCPAGDLCDHAARGGARLCGATLWRPDSLAAGAHQPQSHAPHRSDRHHRHAFDPASRDPGKSGVRLGEAGAGQFRQSAPPQAGHAVGGRGWACRQSGDDDDLGYGAETVLCEWRRRRHFRARDGQGGRHDQCAVHAVQPAAHPAAGWRARGFLAASAAHGLALRADGALWFSDPDRPDAAQPVRH